MADTRRMGDGDTFDPFAGSDAGASDDGRWEADASGRATNVSGGDWRAPAGRRDGVDRIAASREAKREPHAQDLRAQEPRIDKFEGAQFVGWIKHDMKFLRNGDLEIAVHIPFRYKHLAMPMSDAFGLPLSIDVQVWSPAREALDDAG